VPNLSNIAYELCTACRQHKVNIDRAAAATHWLVTKHTLVHVTPSYYYNITVSRLQFFTQGVWYHCATVCTLQLHDNVFAPVQSLDNSPCALLSTLPGTWVVLLVLLLLLVCLDASVLLLPL
jgi:hypothetical protein